MLHHVLQLVSDWVCLLFAAEQVVKSSFLQLMDTTLMKMVKITLNSEALGQKQNHSAERHKNRINGVEGIRRMISFCGFVAKRTDFHVTYGLYIND